MTGGRGLSVTDRQSQNKLKVVSFVPSRIFRMKWVKISPEEILFIHILWYVVEFSFEVPFYVH